MDHGDFDQIFRHFWWLLFPILSMIWGMIDLWARHRRAREGLQLIKSYLDQGKEPPPELIKLLDTKASVYGNCSTGNVGWVPVFLFAALCAAFLMAPYWPGINFPPKQSWALHLVALVFGGLCLGCLVTTMRQERDRKPRP